MVRYEVMDNETGESTSVISIQNVETGEEEFITPQFRPYRKTFKIPSAYFNPSSKEQQKQQQKYPQLDKDTSCCISATAILFLLPTTVFFYPILSLIVVALETVLHMWVHRKNKTLKNDDVYYRSPLHIICKEFCAPCREESMKLKITKIQDKRNDKLQKYGLEYVRRIVT